MTRRSRVFTICGFVVGTTTLIGLRRKQVEEQLEQLNRLLEQRVDKRTAERDLAEIALQQQQALAQSLVDSLPLNVFRKDLESRFIFANQRFCEELGCSLDEIVGKTDFDFFEAELAKKYREDDQHVVQSGTTLEAIEEHLTPSGEKLYVQVMKAPVRDAQGQIIGTRAMFWDVTARVRAEQAQQQADARFRRLVQSNIIGVMTAHTDGLVLEANNAFLEVIGYSHHE